SPKRVSDPKLYRRPSFANSSACRQTSSSLSAKRLQLRNLTSGRRGYRWNGLAATPFCECRLTLCNLTARWFETALSDPLSDPARAEPLATNHGPRRPILRSVGRWTSTGATGSASKHTLRRDDHEIEFQV